MKQILQTNSFEETQKIGEEFASRLQGGDVVCLRGDLGAGKTTFMQGLAKGLGVSQRIISPTFIIVRKYEIPSAVILGNEMNPESSMQDPGQAGMTIKTLYHIDLYRTETEDDLKGLGFPELLEEKNAIIAIEWAEKLSSLLPKKRWELDFEWISENERKIEIRKIS